MRYFIVGDYRTGTGPANVTKYYIENFPKGTLCQVASSKIGRAIELPFKIMCSDVVIFSGYSKQNILGLKLAGMFKKKTIDLLHGSVEHENAINMEPSEEMNRIERETMRMSDCIVCVSKRFAGWLKENYPEYESKIEYVYNGIDEKIVDAYADKEMYKCAQNKINTIVGEALDASLVHEKLIMSRTYTIFSVGGGMPRKQIKNICKAVEMLNTKHAVNINKHNETDNDEDKNIRYELVVVGDKGYDTDEINRYPFVKNLGIVTFDKTIEMYKSCDVFVQNSSFETFGLAPIEAIFAGSNVLLSGEIGAIDIIEGLEENDIIRDYSDAKEIADKIERVIAHPNNDRLRNSIDWEKNSWKMRSKELMQIASKLF